MNRRQFLATMAAPALAAARRPNIFVLLMDDFGIGHCSPYSETMNAAMLDPAYREFLRNKDAGIEPEEALALSRRAMPVLHALARRGTVFTQAFSSSNLCAPARAGIFTGQNPNRFGIYNNIDFDRQGLPPGSMLVERLRNAGYATAMIGKYHTGTRNHALRAAVLARHGVTQAEFARLPEARRAPIAREIVETGFEGSVVDEHHPLRYGFDYYFGYNFHQCPFYNSEQIWENHTYTGKQPKYNTELFTEKAIGFARRALAEKKPFCIEMALHAMHGPLRPQAPDKYFLPFASRSFELQNYYGHIHAVDAAIGAFRDAIGPEEWANTLFVFAGDNGAPVSVATPPPGNGPHRGHKGSFFLGGIRVPLIVHWPAGGGKGQRNAALVSTVDIMPTALEAAGLPAAPGIDGRSLLPLARGKAARTREHLLLSGIHSRAWGYSGETTIGAAANVRREESPGAWVVTDGTYLLRFTGAIIPGLYRDAAEGVAAHYELYDLREDPGETRDLARQLPAVVERMRKRYEAEAKDWPAPPVWRRDRWAELLPGRR